MQVVFLLEKYKNIGYSQKRIKEILLDIFSKKNIILTKDEIEIKDTEVKIKISGSKRTHFILHKKNIEEEIQIILKKENLNISKIF